MRSPTTTTRASCVLLAQCWTWAAVVSTPDKSAKSVAVRRGGVPENYQRAAQGTILSERQAYRWVAGELRGLRRQQARATLETMFAEPVARLFGPPYGLGALAPSRGRHATVPQRGTARTDWEGQVIAMSADRARDFLTRIEASNVGTETLDQLVDDLRRLVIAFEHQPLPTLLGDLVDTQDRAFGGVAGTRSALAIARVFHGEIDGAAEALGPVLEPPQRIHGVVTSVEHVRAALRSVDNPGREVIELAGAIEGWTAERLTLPE